MNGSKYYDSAAVIQVIGCTMKNPNLLDDDGKYFYGEYDFTSDFHKVVFGAIYNLHALGANKITTKDIENYFENRDQSKGIYNASKGSEWLIQTVENADLANFDYYYDRMKKMTLFRGYEECGMDMRFLYNPDEIFDLDKKKKQEDYIDSLTLNEIADIIENRINDIKMRCVDNATDEAESISEGIFDLLASFEERPEMGMPLYGTHMNVITRGARRGKLYIRSAATGVGKTRSMIADMCYLSCDKIYRNNQWEKIESAQQPALFISTELDMSEIQTMALAFLSNVNEEKILKNHYDFDGEKERVIEAAKILENSQLYIEIIPDFSLKDIENIIKRNIRLNGVKYIGFDYIHTSMRILEEISRRSGGIKLREDNILFLLSVKLKDICTEFGVFILTSTQLNGDWKKEPIPDQNMLRGAKSISDKADWGSILLDATAEDIEALENILSGGDYPVPNIKLSVYKNRRGQYNKFFLWMKADKGTCRFNSLFATDYQYNLLEDLTRTQFEYTYKEYGEED